MKCALNILLLQSKNCDEKINRSLQHFINYIDKGENYYFRSYFELAIRKGDLKVADVLLKKMVSSWMVCVNGYRI